MIADYAELIVEAADRTGEAGVAQRAAMFVGQAEARLNKRLRVGEMEKTAILTTDVDGNADLPADFAAERSLAVAGCPIERVPVTDIDAGCAGFATSAGKLLTNSAESDLTLRYYAELPPLAQNGTNWLLETDADIYLYSVMQQIYLRKLDTENALAAGKYAASLIDDLEEQDSRQRFSGLTYRTPGVTP